MTKRLSLPRIVVVRALLWLARAADLDLWRIRLGRLALRASLAR